MYELYFDGGANPNPGRAGAGAVVYKNNEEILEELHILKEELNRNKCLIDEYYDKWELIKKNINEYEYIYISSNYKNNITNVDPISRSYFKFVELNYEYELINNNKKNYNIVNLCEAPGGFIQSILDLKY